jgi:multidrug resistance efflux pump
MIKARRLLPALLVGAACATTFAVRAGTDDNHIGALGTVQPHGGVAVLVGPGGSTIAEILAAVNQPVHKGQVLARLSSYASAQAELDAVRLDKADQIATHDTDKRLRELDVAQAQSNLKRAERSLANYLGMTQNSQAAVVRDERENQVEDARHTLESDELKLRSLESSYQDALKKSENREKQAELTVAQAEIRAPFDGVVLDVQKQLGETSAGPFCTLADVSSMEVSAEVFEGDLAKLKPGQTVTVTGKSLPEAMSGKLESIGRSINVDRKVAKALIRLDKTEPAAHYIGMEVNVSIHP